MIGSCDCALNENLLRCQHLGEGLNDDGGGEAEEESECN